MTNQYDYIVQRLKSKGLLFTAGLTDSEIEACENFYQIQFPLPIKEFYSFAFPAFYRWRDFSPQNITLIKEVLNWPLEGLLFDVGYNGFWYDAWGNEPENIEEKKQICMERFSTVPKLFPIIGHRYMPCVENESNLPVYSVWQTDIIYYGENLSSFLDIEFGFKPHSAINYKSIPRIKFWGDIAG